MLGVACAWAGIGPLVVSSWGALSQSVASPDKPLYPTTRQVVAAADVLIVDAPALIEPIRPMTKRSARVEHLPMGADTRRFCPGRTPTAQEWRAFFGIPDDAFVLVSPRSWAELYGHQTILQAYVQAFPRLRQPTVLAFVGLGDGPQALPYLAEAWKQVEQTEAAQTVAGCPRSATMRCTPSTSWPTQWSTILRRDSFPATLVEAAACETPAITAFLPTYRDTFVETACTLVEPGNPAALAEAMVEVVNQPPAERAIRLAEARQIVEREYDDTVIKQRLWTLYAELSTKP